MGELEMSGAADQAAVPESRGALQGVTLLLPVWGARYVRQCLDFCLPTLLAPGNVPALAKALPCRMTVMTSEADAPLIQAHPAWRELSRHCTADIRLVDDLITGDNHSTTITLAFAREIRAAGARMRNTCFIFLLGDYLLADRSLAAVLARVMAGANGVLAGNFQMVAEDAIPMLRQRLDRSQVAISLAPRELIRWSLAHLHPATTANIVDFPLNHNEHTNRLFWRAGDTTLIGRFYLLHMIGIRPEVTDFVIGSSCDYSFIPEMCPSGKVAILSDSDEFLMIEMQPRDHERRHLRWGPIDPKSLAASLSEWTTIRHRENVKTTLLYHAAELAPPLEEARARADAFIRAVDRYLTSEPRPHRDHPYWIGAIEAHRRALGDRLDAAALNRILGRDAMRPGGSYGWLWRLRGKLFGAYPDIAALHPRWPDMRWPMAALRRIVAQRGSVLVICDAAEAFARWLRERSPGSAAIAPARLLGQEGEGASPLSNSFDACLLLLRESDLPSADELLGRATGLLGPDGKIVISVVNERVSDAAAFGATFAAQAGRLGASSLRIDEVRFIRMSRSRRLIARAMTGLGQATIRRPALAPLAAMLGAGLMAAAYCANRLARASPNPPRHGYCSSVFVAGRRAQDSPSA